jgi:hypothetical protein
MLGGMPADEENVMHVISIVSSSFNKKLIFHLIVCEAWTRSTISHHSVRKELASTSEKMKMMMALGSQYSKICLNVTDLTSPR